MAIRQRNPLGGRVAHIAMQEWWLFGSQFVDGENSRLPIHTTQQHHGALGDGSQPGFQQRVWSYFREGVCAGGEGWRDYTGWAWSGAFISYCFLMGRAGDAFPYAPAHHTYVMEGVRNRLNGNGQGLVTHGIGEIKPMVGDMLWKGRHETAGWTFDDLKRYAGNSDKPFRSHCDIVVGVDEAGGTLFVIGGNVRNRVLRLTVPLDADGRADSEIYTVLVTMEDERRS